MCSVSLGSCTGDVINNELKRNRLKYCSGSCSSVIKHNVCHDLFGIIKTKFIAHSLKLTRSHHNNRLTTATMITPGADPYDSR